MGIEVSFLCHPGLTLVISPVRACRNECVIYNRSVWPNNQNTENIGLTWEGIVAGCAYYPVKFAFLYCIMPRLFLNFLQELWISGQKVNNCDVFYKDMDINIFALRSGWPRNRSSTSARIKNLISSPRGGPTQLLNGSWGSFHSGTAVGEWSDRQHTSNYDVKWYMKLSRLSFFAFRTVIRNSARKKNCLLLYLNLYEFVTDILITQLLLQLNAHFYY
jgi:hypothetical protein